LRGSGRSRNPQNHPEKEKLNKKEQKSRTEEENNSGWQIPKKTTDQIDRGKGKIIQRGRRRRGTRSTKKRIEKTFINKLRRIEEKKQKRGRGKR